MKVLMDKPLGKGAFGRVYRGLLQPKKQSGWKVFKDQMTSKQNYVVAVKMLKG